MKRILPRCNKYNKSKKMKKKKNYVENLVYLVYIFLVPFVSSSKKLFLVSTLTLNFGSKTINIRKTDKKFEFLVENYNADNFNSSKKLKAWSHLRQKTIFKSLPFRHTFRHEKLTCSSTYTCTVPVQGLYTYPNSGFWFFTSLYAYPNSDKVRVNKIIEDGLNSIFEKKEFKIEEKNVKHSPILNFFDSQTEFVLRPKKSIPFKCIQCGCFYKAKLGESGNMKKHLEKFHKNVRNWLISYTSQLDRSQRKWNLDENLTNLAKYFLTSSKTINELSNPYLRKMLKFKISSEDTFKTNVLPEL
ncbi:hypothetical protein BpHYR1_049629 [Brachionus plicatilis]|uniref:Uncharacterized protein n=1 Tax=Brachionus plicatilis TaxID=10195 RepID=A0A3M7T2N1_BRAPC|nr:hypothetical protein BpHYR1_049629 [Brachionus plicatilis]